MEQEVDIAGVTGKTVSLKSLKTEKLYREDALLDLLLSERAGWECKESQLSLRY